MIPDLSYFCDELRAVSHEKGCWLVDDEGDDFIIVDANLKLSAWSVFGVAGLNRKPDFATGKELKILSDDDLGAPAASSSGRSVGAGIS